MAAIEGVEGIVVEKKGAEPLGRRGVRKDQTRSRVALDQAKLAKAGMAADGCGGHLMVGTFCA